MPTFGNVNSGGGGSSSGGGGLVVGIFLVLAALVIVAYLVMGAGACPIELTRGIDGALTLQPSGQKFADMNEFQQWWHSSGMNARCPLPLQRGPREVDVLLTRNPTEQTYAKTPIYKVDDYEFSRIFGVERGGHMEIPRQNFNMILNDRNFDWADRPMSSDERKGKYAGLVEGFTADGVLTSEREAVARYGERSSTAAADDIECKVSREAREVAKMVARAYENDPSFEPVITKVGANHWEVNELKPRRPVGNIIDDVVVDERVVDTQNDAVDIQYRYRERPVAEEAIDPYFTGTLPFASDRYGDPFAGPVPGMERMFGPTFDHVKWY